MISELSVAHRVASTVARAVLPRAECRGGSGVAVSTDSVAVSPIQDEAAAPITWLTCATCGNRIAKNSDRIEVNARHEHTFINPVGVIYKIGCFGTAVGVLEVGPKSEEFTWFIGHTWCCLVCSGCNGHLGWSFNSTASRFLGLILSQLCEDGTAGLPSSTHA